MEHVTFAPAADGDQNIALRRTPHEADLHAWAMEQAELIRLGRLQELDVDNLVDEVGDMARRVRQEFVSRLGPILTHLLKWDDQSDRRSASWARTVREQRRQFDELPIEAPSFRARLPAMFGEAYEQGRVGALNETGLPEAAIPGANPYSWDDAMARPIAWPEP